MKSKINWKNHLAEFFVVVLGILMAFQLNECSLRDSQQSLVKSHIDYLKEESQFNLRSIGYTISDGEKTLKKIDSIIVMIQSKRSIDSINEESFELLNIGYLYVRKNAYNSLVNSGDIRFIKSFDLKKDIIDMYEYYGWTQSYDDSNREVYFSDLFPYFKNNFDLINGTVQKPQIYYSKKYLNILSTYRHTLNAKLKKFKDCKKEVSNFISKL